MHIDQRIEHNLLAGLCADEEVWFGDGAESYDDRATAADAGSDFLPVAGLE